MKQSAVNFCEEFKFFLSRTRNTRIKNLTLDLEQGQKIAILGKTGSGKSSLLQLLVRNYDANQGELLLAEKPISAYSEETLRRQICF